MRSLFAALVLIASVSLVGCHTCDVCDDCGDAYYGNHGPAPCTNCGPHAVVQPKAAIPVSQTAAKHQAPVR